MKIGFLLFENWHNKKEIGSSKIRGHWLIKHWPGAEIFQQGGKYDVIIFQKTYWPEYCRVFKGIKILDLCDPDWTEGQPVKEMIDEVDMITTSTEALAEAVRKFTDKKVVCIPDRIDLDIHIADKKHERTAKWVAWFGYSHNTSVLNPTINSLKRNKLMLRVISNFRPPYNKADKNIKWDNDNPSFNFNDELKKADFVILPPDNRPRGKYKSNNKTIISWALGMPVAKSIDDLKKFTCPKERRKEVRLRLKEVQEKWDVKISVSEMQNLIKEIQNKKEQHGNITE